jgi:hypothetical protein
VWENFSGNEDVDNLFKPLMQEAWRQAAEKTWKAEQMLK